MQKEKNKYTITKIEFKKKEVVLHYFYDEEKELALFPSVYSDFFLYEGKELDENELKEIQKKNAYAKYLQTAYILLAKKEYSVATFIKKLEAKKIPISQIHLMIQVLIEQNLLNDERYAEDLVDLLQLKNYGKNYIIKKLEEEGISSHIIHSFYFDKEREREKMQNLLPCFLRKYEKDNRRTKRDHLYHEFLKYGYDSDDIHELLSSLKEESKEDELMKCRKEFEKYQRIYQNKYSVYECDKRIITTLMRKGFSYDIIKQVMECVYDATDESNEMD